MRRFVMDDSENGGRISKPSIAHLAAETGQEKNRADQNH